MKELGGMKHINGKEVYITTPNADKALKDINRFLSNENP